MGLREPLRGRGIVPKVGLDRIDPAIARGDLRHVPVHLSRLRANRHHPHDRSLRKRLDRIAHADLDIVSAPVDTVEDEIVAIPKLVGEASRRHAADQWIRQRGRVMHRQVGRGAGESPGAKLALKRTDYVPTFAQAAQSVLQPGHETPLRGAGILGQPQRGKLAQAAGAQRVLQWVFASGGDDALRVHVPKEASVERRKALRADLQPLPPLDLDVGARPQVQRHQLGEPLAHSSLYIFRSDDQVLAFVVPAAKHDVRVRMRRIEMIHGDPVQPSPEVRLHLP